MRQVSRGRSSYWSVLAALIVLIAFVSGCGKKGWLETYSVKGKVLVDGKPAKEVHVTFHPKESMGDKPYTPSGKTDENGEFALSTFVEKDGAPAGEYDVTFVWPERFNPISTLWEGDKLKGRYGKKEKQAVKMTVQKKAQELPPFELKTSDSK